MFNEQNTVEDFLRDRLIQGDLGGGVWKYINGKELDRSEEDVLIVGGVRDALLRLNPEISDHPELVDEVIYKLQAILVSSSGGNLVGANEEFREWLTGAKSMPFGPDGEHVDVRLIDFAKPESNHFVIAQQVTYRQGHIEVRFDLALYVNGIPLVVIEAKTPVRKAVTWVDGAIQIHDDYERNAPRFFVPNAFSVATDGKELRYGAIRMPLLLWGPWRSDDSALASLSEVEQAAASLLDPLTVLDIVSSFTFFATDKKHRKIKAIPRYQQYEAANRIVERVIAGKPRKGLIWHFQGSGKSLLMVFAAQKLRLHPALRNPTVLIVVDRIDLDTQISATFHSHDIPNLVGAGTRKELARLLDHDVRKVIITTIYKFEEGRGVLNERDNVIALVDEAHRTQEGDLGEAMREALPNAFLFGLTGTPINRRDRNTFRTFGAEEDERGYMSLYSFGDSVRDGATLPLHFEARMVELRVDQDAIDEAYRELAGSMSSEDQEELAKRAAKLGVLVRAPERVRSICEDIAGHYRENVEPNGFKAQVVVFDRQACLLYKEQLDELLGPEASAVVMDSNKKGTEGWLQLYERWKGHVDRSKDEEERLLDRFRDPADPLKVLIVTSKLLTGFDAPILQAMYLDRPIRDHNLLQAICRTNRTYTNKTHGLVVDYLGVFDDVAQALDFDEKDVQAAITSIERLREALPAAMLACLDFFPDVDRTIAGYEGLMDAQDCLPDNDARDSFASAYTFLARHWEALAPDPVLAPYREDYRWLTGVYESVQPPSGQGKLLWHALGAKTVELIQENVHVEVVRDDLETLVMDADVLEDLLNDPEPDKKAKELEIKLIQRLKKHSDGQHFVELGERLEKLRERHEQGMLLSLDYLKELAELAKQAVQAEREIVPVEEQNLGKAALTELFEDTRSEDTPIIVERVVADIDDIVEKVRFPEWQHTVEGERTVKQALRRTLLKYKLHKDDELFEKAYGYIKQYY
ncbi:MAG TPA: HsdR family type I site-specific deoxyribonuclease [Solirubrobacterales bacterium]|nr:HsdR family type I site-specific deoxyribonuclease [Solirubrobacterales bacterium]